VAFEEAILATPASSAAGVAALVRVHMAIWGSVALDGSDAGSLEHRFMRAVLNGVEAIAQKGREQAP